MALTPTAGAGWAEGPVVGWAGRPACVFIPVVEEVSAFVVGVEIRTTRAGATAGASDSACLPNRTIDIDLVIRVHNFGIFQVVPISKMRKMAI